MNYCKTCNTGTPHRVAVPERLAAVCNEGGTENEITYVPLFVITGGGGCGKSTAAIELLRKSNPYCVIDAEYLGHGKGGFDTWEECWNGVAIVCRTFGHNRLPLVLAGWIPPGLWEGFHSSQFFSPTYFLVLVSDPETQRRRLEARAVTTPDKFEFALGATVTMTAEAEERENATILDTSGMTPKQLGAAADRWILERLVE